MLAPTFILAALVAQSALAAPNLAASILAARAGKDNNNGTHTNGTHTNGTHTNGTHTNGNHKNSTLGAKDTQILQFALNLENLENNFYTTGLNQFNDSAFQVAGFQPSVRQRFVQIAQHEATHVQLLQSILGANAPQPCNYSFPYTDPASFASLSFALESAGESAYLGASTLLKNETALEIAGTILTVEARQASWVSSSVLNNSPWNGPFDTPLEANLVFSLASQFITACPSSNPPLPVSPLPNLAISPANATTNQTVTVSLTGQPDFSPSNIPITNSSLVASTVNGSAPLYLAYYHGFNVSFSRVQNDNTTTVPEDLAGIVYTSLVSSRKNPPTRKTTLSGLAVLNIPVPAEAVNSVN